jgi:hypothetical protein
VFEYVPALHFVQLLARVAEIMPGWHVLHTSAPALANFPAGQLIIWLATARV